MIYKFKQCKQYGSLWDLVVDPEVYICRQGLDQFFQLPKHFVYLWIKVSVKTFKGATKLQMKTGFIDDRRPSNEIFRLFKIDSHYTGPLYVGGLVSLNLVTQPPNSSLCGQCVVSMITGQSLQSVIKVMGTERNFPRNMMKGFRAFGFKMAARSVPQCDEVAAVIQDSRHWIAWDGTHFYDPLGLPRGENSNLRFYPVVQM